MSKVTMTVGGAMEKEAARRFIDAWRRAENGETFRERQLAFESWDALARVLTGKRMELLRYVRRHKVASVSGTSLGARPRLPQRARGRASPGGGAARCRRQRSAG